MSDHAKRAGVILMLTALLISILPLIMTQTNRERKYHTPERRKWLLREIKTEKNGRIKINTADSAELEMLPGIGATYAERILQEKLRNGPFYYPEDLEAVNGIGSQTLTGFRPMIDMTLDESGN